MLSRYLKLVGILHWYIELGRIDILHEAVGHLGDLYHIFSYLNNNMNMGRISYDMMDPNVDLSVFNNNADWTYLYEDFEE